VDYWINGFMDFRFFSRHSSSNPFIQ